jgi:hypothetical protein
MRDQNWPVIISQAELWLAGTSTPRKPFAVPAPLPPRQPLPTASTDRSKPMLKLGLDVHLEFIVAVVQRGHLSPHIQHPVKPQWKKESHEHLIDHGLRGGRTRSSVSNVHSTSLKPLRGSGFTTFDEHSLHCRPVSFTEQRLVENCPAQSALHTTLASRNSEPICRHLSPRREGREYEIPKAAWPESIKRFQPLSVQAHVSGALIVISRVDREQHGLLVMLDPKGDPGAGGSGAGYDSLGDGLFWCWEKIRRPYIPPSQRTNG